MREGAVLLKRVSAGEKHLLRALLDDYLAELASRQGEEMDRDATGHVPYRWFDRYWQDAGRIPFVVTVDGRIIGLCLLRDTGAHWSIAEFYVQPSDRRRGVGARAVSLLIEFCRSTRLHRVLEARTLRWNEGAARFWRSRGFRLVGEGDDGPIFQLALD